MTKTRLSSAPGALDQGRRRLLKWSAGALAAELTTARVADAVPAERRLAFYNTHTDESLSVVYRVGADYVAESLAEIDRLLRDHRTDEVHAMDMRLLDLLHALSTLLHARAAFHVISGYRSPTTNTVLASMNGGVAARSLHMAGKAIDIRLPGVDLRQLRTAAVALRGGGVGYYAQSDFVHIDVGHLRYW